MEPVSWRSGFAPPVKPLTRRLLVYFASGAYTADIAAGIAREFWYREGLVSVVRHFDYVLLNGVRMSETTAASYPYFYPPFPKR